MRRDPFLTLFVIAVLLVVATAIMLGVSIALLAGKGIT